MGISINTIFPPFRWCNLLILNDTQLEDLY